MTYGPIIELLLYSRRFHLCAYGLIYWPLLGRVGLFSLLVWRPSRERFGPRSSRTRHHHFGCCLYSWWLYFNWDLELHFKIMKYESSFGQILTFDGPDIHRLEEYHRWVGCAAARFSCIPGRDGGGMSILAHDSGQVRMDFTGGSRPKSSWWSQAGQLPAAAAAH